MEDYFRSVEFLTLPPPSPHKHSRSPSWKGRHPMPRQSHFPTPHHKIKSRVALLKLIFTRKTRTPENENPEAPAVSGSRGSSSSPSKKSSDGADPPLPLRAKITWSMVTNCGGDASLCAERGTEEEDVLLEEFEGVGAVLSGRVGADVGACGGGAASAFFLKKLVSLLCLFTAHIASLFRCGGVHTRRQGLL